VVAGEASRVEGVTADLAQRQAAGRWGRRRRSSGSCLSCAAALTTPHLSAYRFRPGEEQRRKTHLLANPRRGLWPMPPTAPAAPETFTLTPPTIQVNNLSGNFQVTEPTMTTEFAPRKRKGEH